MKCDISERTDAQTIITSSSGHWETQALVLGQSLINLLTGEGPPLHSQSPISYLHNEIVEIPSYFQVLSQRLFMNEHHKL